MQHLALVANIFLKTTLVHVGECNKCSIWLSNLNIFIKQKCTLMYSTNVAFDFAMLTSLVTLPMLRLLSSKAPERKDF